MCPEVKKGGWSRQEDKLIFDSYVATPSKWSLISIKFPGRTENSVKNRFYSTLRKIAADSRKKKLANKEPMTDQDKKPLANATLNELLTHLEEAHSLVIKAFETQPIEEK